MSYRHSLRNVKTGRNLDALLFQLAFVDVYSDLTKPALQYKLDDPAQPMLEVLLIQRPVVSALDPSPAFEILKVSLVKRTDVSAQRTMHFLSWDDHGELGTLSHYLSYVFTGFVAFLSSGFWPLFGFVMAFIIVFVVVVLLCVFGWEMWSDDYEKAQLGKHRRKSSAKGKPDVESGRMKGRFKTADELGLGLASRGQVVGMGKSD